jgi:hypothetical protein
MPSSPKTFTSGLSKDLEKDYSDSFSDSAIKYMFSVVVNSTIMEQHGKIYNYESCITASENSGNCPFYPYTILLNKINGKTRKLQDWEVTDLVKFEENEEEYTKFIQIMTKKRKTCMIMQDVEDEDIEEIIIEKSSEKGSSGGSSCGSEPKHKLFKDLKSILQERDKEINILKEQQSIRDKQYSVRDRELKSVLRERNKEIDRLKEQLAEINTLKEQLSIRDRELRQVAMKLINDMDDIVLDSALLDRNPKFKLPKFPRAQVGDPDYPKSITPKPSLVTFPKRRLRSVDLDRNISNYAGAYRWMLRWMSEEDFSKMCYLEI